MDQHRKAELMGSTFRPLNETHDLTVVVTSQGVDVVSIILWALGGILLIALLALMGRMILWRKKDITRAPRIIRPDVFRIRIDTQFRPALDRNSLFWRRNEIWNWIPHIPPRLNTSSFISSSPATGDSLRLPGGLIMHPPSYSEVMSNSSFPRVQISHERQTPSSSSHLPPL